MTTQASTLQYDVARKALSDLDFQDCSLVQQYTTHIELNEINAPMALRIVWDAGAELHEREHADLYEYFKHQLVIYGVDKLILGAVSRQHTRFKGDQEDIITHDSVNFQDVPRAYHEAIGLLDGSITDGRNATHYLVTKYGRYSTTTWTIEAFNFNKLHELGYMFKTEVPEHHKGYLVGYPMDALGAEDYLKGGVIPNE